MTQPLRRSLLRASIGLAAALACGTSALAQSADAWPSRPVTVVVGFASGGPTDVIARLLAEQLSAKFGQSFVVDNKAGAGGGVAAALVKKAPADGYTLMFGSSGTLTIAPHLQKSLQYDAVRDFTPIGLAANYPYMLVAPTSSGLNSLDALLQRGRAPDARLSYGSAGNGAVNHLAGEWFKHEAKIDAQHVPYRGDSAAVVDLVAGRLDFAFLAGAAVLPHVQSGKLRVLASGSETPGRGGAGVRTLAEVGFKGFSAEPWNGLMAPAGLPKPIVDRLNAAINEIMNRKDVMARLAVLEQYPLTGTPEQFAARIQAQSQRWATVIRTSNIKTD